MQYDKGSIFKTKEFGKKETAIKKDEFLFMIIATQDNKTESWSLVIANATYNHSPSLLGAHTIHRQFAYIDKVKKLFIF